MAVNYLLLFHYDHVLIKTGRVRSEKEGAPGDHVLKHLCVNWSFFLNMERSTFEVRKNYTHILIELTVMSDNLSQPSIWVYSSRVG